MDKKTKKTSAKHISRGCYTLHKPKYAHVSLGESIKTQHMLKLRPITLNKFIFFIFIFIIQQEQNTLGSINAPRSSLSQLQRLQPKGPIILQHFAFSPSKPQPLFQLHLSVLLALIHHELALS